MPYIILIILIAVIFLALQIRRITVYQFERGLKYTKGKFTGVLDPGVYWYIGFWVAINTVDARPKLVTVPGQEVISADGIPLKLSIAAKFEILDLDTAVHNIANSYEQAFYIVIQLALREIVGALKIDDLLANRNQINEQLLEKARDRVDELGLKLISAEVKDIMFPGELKKIFTQVARARQEGLAMLEQARGETAALRHLANSANLLKNNPCLMQLRMLQTKGNTLVMGMPPSISPFPVNKANGSGPADSQNESVE